MFIFIKGKIPGFKMFVIIRKVQKTRGKDLVKCVSKETWTCLQLKSGKGSRGGLQEHAFKVQALHTISKRSVLGAFTIAWKTLN